MTEGVLERPDVSAVHHPGWLSGPHSGQAGEAGQTAGARDDERHDQHQDAQHLRPGPTRPGLSHPRHRPSNILQVTNLQTTSSQSDVMELGEVGWNFSLQSMPL